MGDESTWRPSASMEVLRARAALLARVRGFFARRGVLEVETPLLCAAATTDPHLHSLEATLGAASRAPRTLYLQTSPEFAMKRLLAAGSGSIYQICKVFRDDEAGRLHNPEFTLLEWYRCGFDHHALMSEVDALLDELLGAGTAQRRPYYAVFEEFTDIDLRGATLGTLRARAGDHGYVTRQRNPAMAWDELTNFLMSHVVAPRLGRDGPVFVYDYPASQAAMARLRPATPPVAERFELFIDGIELANGYHELNDGREQQRRFVEDNRRRELAGAPLVKPDMRLLRALEHGLPDCAGVAMGIDRLTALAVGANALSEVMAFPIRLA